ncbi:hypothetical protein CASFOL_005318 [Castilleja foliolosa]|uniref:Uncharacterized protein n=1 Tax=Castilleja foliolosa TaxID=1961234 RepID=A0ABD3E334_9LAMI
MGCITIRIRKVFESRVTRGAAVTLKGTIDAFVSHSSIHSA